MVTIVHRAAETLSAIVGLAALVACGGTISRTIPPPTAALSDASNSAKNTRPTLFVSDYAGVNLYAESSDPDKLGEIGGTSVPYGLYVNKRGDLFVGNSQASNVLVYQRGSRAPFETLSDPNELPYGVTEDSQETVYVANALTTSAGPGDIAVYPRGSLTPSKTFADRKWTSPVAIASDASDNLYVCFSTGTSWGVDEFPAGKTKPQNLGLQLTSCWGIVIDKDQNIVVADLQGRQVDVFPPRATTPSHTLPVAADPFALTLSSNSKEIFVSDYSDNNVNAYTYPDGKLVETIPQSGSSEAAGIAVDPPAAK